MARLKSILIGLMIIIMAVGCFFLAAFMVDFPVVKSVVIYSSRDPIENIFLVLVSIIIGIMMVVFNIGDSSSKRATPEGWFIFCGSITIFALFGIAGLMTLAIGGKLIVAAYTIITGNKI